MAMNRIHSSQESGEHHGEAGRRETHDSVFVREESSERFLVRATVAN